MSTSRKARAARAARTVRHGKPRVRLEWLEARTLLSTTAATPGSLPPETYSVSLSDAPVDTAPIPVSLEPNVSYTLRQLVGYYDDYYNLTGDLVIDLAAGATYTLSDVSSANPTSEWAGRLDTQNNYGDLDVASNNYSGIGRLVFEVPSGQPATITCSDVIGTKIPIDRIFHVLTGGSLVLDNIKVQGGRALDNGLQQSTDAEGGAILVDSGAGLSLESCTIQNNSAVGTTGPDVVGASLSGRAGAGYNAMGGGIYGAAGSTIAIDANTVIQNNFAEGGKGGNVSGNTLHQGGKGGGAYGGGIAVDAPSSATGSSGTNVATVLTIDGGASIASNYLNQGTPSGNLARHGGTGGACTGGTGGAGGDAYGAGLYMGTGQLNLNGGASQAAVMFSNNSEYAGLGYSSGTSGSNAGPNGSANGGGATISPGLVDVTSGPTSGGIFQFSNNLVNGVTGYGFYLPTVTTATDTGSTSANGPWNLRTAVAAANPLVASGMFVTLNLPSATLALEPSQNGGTNTGSLVVSNSGSGTLEIKGTGPTSSLINAAALGASAFSFSSANVILNNLAITGASISGNGGAIDSVNSKVNLTTASLKSNLVSTSTGEGGGIYQSGGSLTLSKTNLTNNKAASGGGVYLTNGASMTLFSGSFTSNTASNNGGAIDAQNASIQMSYAAFVQNHATAGAGGAIATSGTTTVDTGCGFQSNTAGTNGGAIAASGNSKFTMNQGNLLTNTAGQSGGGFALTGGAATINTATIKSNSAGSTSGSGGGLFESGGTLTLNHEHLFTNNKAASGGGVVAYGGKLRASGPIDDNSAEGSGSGGGICALSNAAVSLASAQLSGNTAPGGFGGGIYQVGGTLTIRNSSTLSQNSATQGGGAYVTGASASMNGGSITGNTATINGGGFLSWHGNFQATGVSVASNRVGSGSTISGYGGGLYQNDGGTLRLGSGTKVVNNSAQYGGGILSDQGAFFANGATIKGNTAVTTGGGLYAQSNSQVNFTNAHVSSNAIAATGGAGGGGLYVSGGTLNANGLSVNNNRISFPSGAIVGGGGLYATNVKINLNGGTSSTTTFSGNTLAGSSAQTSYGGAIYLTSGATLNQQSNLTITNNAITGTTSGVGGGIAFFANTAFTQGSGFALTSTGNLANAGGNNYAFVVTNTSDSNYTSGENGPSGINYFTSGSGSLRSAISYAQNWMNGNSNNQSMAMILTPGASYGVSGSYGTLSTSIPGGTTLTLIGENASSVGQATINASGSGARVFYLGGSGSVVFQNLLVTGGWTNQEYYDSNAAAGGGIYLNGPTLTLNDTSVSGNTAQATVVGTHGYTATNKGGAGGNGGNGRSAYGGGIYMNQGTLNLLSNSSIIGNTVTGSAGGNGGAGGKGGTHDAKLSDCDYTNGGRGGNGGTGGNAYGGGIYQNGGTLNVQSSNVNNVNNNSENYGAGGIGGSGGGSGENEGIECGWGNSGSGTNGSNGSNDNYQNYVYQGGSTVYSWSGAISAQAVGTFSNPALSRIPGIVLELHSADGRLIDTARSGADGSFAFSVPFTGLGYIQVERIATFNVAPRGTTVAPGLSSSFDPTTLRTAVMQFLDGAAVNHKINLVLTPVHAVLRSGPNFVQLTNTDTGAVLWRQRLKPATYHGGFTFATVDLNGDSTLDYVVLPRRGAATPFLVDGLTGRVTRISGTVSPNLVQGFAIDSTSLIGNGRRQLVLFPSNDRSGRVSVIDVNTKSVLWTSSGTVRGGMTVSIMKSFPNNGISPFDVVLTSKTLDVKTDGHNWQVWIDGITGKTIRVLDLTPRNSQTVHLIDVPASSLQRFVPKNLSALSLKSRSVASRPMISSKPASVARPRIPGRHFRPH